MAYETPVYVSPDAEIIYDFIPLEEQDPEDIQSYVRRVGGMIEALRIAYRSHPVFQRVDS